MLSQKKKKDVRFFAQKLSSPTHRSTSEETPSSHENKQNIMSVNWSNGQIGLCYYDCEHYELFTMPDLAEIMDTNVFKKAYLQIDPSVVVVSTTNKNKLITALKQLRPDDDESLFENCVHVLLSIDFALSSCTQRLNTINMPQIHTMSHQQRIMYLSTMLPSQHTNMMKSLGGLLRYLDKKRVGVELESPASNVPVLAIKTFNLDSFLNMGNESFRDLQIFVQETHPSGLVFRNNREGFSLFSLLNKCKSTVGTKMLKDWLRHPLSDINCINARLNMVHFFSTCLLQLQPLHHAIKSIRSLNAIFKRMLQSVGRYNDWRVVLQVLVGCVNAYDIICSHNFLDVESFNQLREHMEDNYFKILAKVISDMIDFEESKEQQRFCVKEGISPELDEKKAVLSNLTSIMDQALSLERETLDSSMHNCLIVYFPQIGFLLTFEATEQMKINKDYNIPDKNFMFEANGMVYYKTEITNRLEEEYGDLKCDIIDIETKHEHELQLVVLKHSDVISEVITIMAEIDCLMSLAHSAATNNYVKPIIVPTDILVIKNCRHPLSELTTNFVPNDVHSGYNNLNNNNPTTHNNQPIINNNCITYNNKYSTFYENHPAPYNYLTSNANAVSNRPSSSPSIRHNVSFNNNSTSLNNLCNTHLNRNTTSSTSRPIISSCMPSNPSRINTMLSDSSNTIASNTNDISSNTNSCVTRQNGFCNPHSNNASFGNSSTTHLHNPYFGNSLSTHTNYSDTDSFIADLSDSNSSISRPIIKNNSLPRINNQTFNGGSSSLSRHKNVYSNINNITRPRNLLHDVDGGIGSSAGGSGGFGSKGNDGSSGDGRKITLLTGANGSGKSIYLKQIGLAVYMAHIGSFVAAEEAEIGLFTDIYTLFPSSYSTSDPFSSFMHDLNKVSVAARSSNARSLILLDEFGKGTIELDGASLLASSIKYWNDVGANCPHIFCTTHHHFIASLLRQCSMLKLMTMQVLLDRDDYDYKEAERSLQKITFLYKVVEGIVTSSHAIEAARLVGLPSSIIKRAIQVLGLVKNKMAFTSVKNGVSCDETGNRDAESNDNIHNNNNNDINNNN